MPSVAASRVLAPTTGQRLWAGEDALARLDPVVEVDDAGEVCARRAERSMTSRFSGAG